MAKGLIDLNAIDQKAIDKHMIYQNTIDQKVGYQITICLKEIDQHFYKWVNITKQFIK